MKSVIIDSKDNVAVMLENGKDIPIGHKFALRDIDIGEDVIKYGHSIGRATAKISKGEWVHTHNLHSNLDKEKEYDYSYNEILLDTQKKTFKGFKREKGRAGIRNEIYIIPTVGCVNNVCVRLASDAQKLIKGSVDGIFALTHQFGCSQLGKDSQNIKELLCGVALNPNASFVLFVGLGCENNSLMQIKEYLEPYNRKNIEYFDCQEVEDEHEYGMNILKKFASQASEYIREDVDFSELCVGLKCGGSDAFSGLTANPLVGKIADKVVGFGGSAVLTEIPEMFGAEQLIMNKCNNKQTFLTYKKTISDFKDYYIKNGVPVYENPSPGNRAGGITTLEEKSLGCVEKAGKTPIVDVLDYGQMVKESGVSVLNAPGNDLIASTALGASGCQLVLFTTGRGTPFSTFVPTLKISSNQALAKFKNNWVDFDGFSMDENGLLELVLDVVNGNYKCKSEDVREIAFYKTGVTL